MRVHALSSYKINKASFKSDAGHNVVRLTSAKGDSFEMSDEQKAKFILENGFEYVGDCEMKFFTNRENTAMDELYAALGQYKALKTFKAANISQIGIEQYINAVDLTFPDFRNRSIQGRNTRLRNLAELSEYIDNIGITSTVGKQNSPKHLNSNLIEILKMHDLIAATQENGYLDAQKVEKYIVRSAMQAYNVIKSRIRPVYPSLKSVH